MVNTFGSGIVPDGQIESLIKRHFDLTPFGIISTLNLLRPIYRPTACYGHFGRDDCVFPWERMDKLANLSADPAVVEALSSLVT